MDIIKDFYFKDTNIQVGIRFHRPVGKVMVVFKSHIFVVSLLSEDVNYLVSKFENLDVVETLQIICMDDILNYKKGLTVLRINFN